MHYAPHVVATPRRACRSCCLAPRARHWKCNPALRGTGQRSHACGSTPHLPLPSPPLAPLPSLVFLASISSPPACRTLHPKLKKLAADHPEVLFLKVNGSREQLRPLFEAHGITKVRARPRGRAAAGRRVMKPGRARGVFLGSPCDVGLRQSGLGLCDPGSSACSAVPLNAACCGSPRAARPAFAAATLQVPFFHAVRDGCVQSRFSASLSPEKLARLRQELQAAAVAFRQAAAGTQLHTYQHQQQAHFTQQQQHQHQYQQQQQQQQQQHQYQQQQQQQHTAEVQAKVAVMA